MNLELVEGSRGFLWLWGRSSMSSAWSFLKPPKVRYQAFYLCLPITITATTKKPNEFRAISTKSETLPGTYFWTISIVTDRNGPVAINTEGAIRKRLSLSKIGSGDKRSKFRNLSRFPSIRKSPRMAPDSSEIGVQTTITRTSKYVANKDRKKLVLPSTLTSALLH